VVLCADGRTNTWRRAHAELLYHSMGGAAHRISPLRTIFAHMGQGLPRIARALLALLTAHHRHAGGAQRVGAALADIKPLRVAVDQLARGEVQVTDAAARDASLAGHDSIAREDLMQRVYQRAHVAAHITAWPGVVRAIIFVHWLAGDRRALDAPRGGERRCDDWREHRIDGWGDTLGSLTPLGARPLPRRIEPIEPATARWSGARGRYVGAHFGNGFLRGLCLCKRGLGRMPAAPASLLTGLLRD
jgi:hypothetical protein